VAHPVNWQALLEQPGPPRLDQNILKGDRAAKRLRILLLQTTIAAIGPSPIQVKILGSTLGKKDGYVYQ
jgi:hypothetical protein